MSHFIVLTTPRSGSTWLGSLLQDHPDVSMYGELFLPHDVPDKYKYLRQHDPEKFFRFREKTKLRRPKVTNAYLDHVFSSPDNTIGFKLMAYPLMTHPEIIFYCKKHHIRIIHLSRNIHDQVISYALAEARNNFHKLEQDIDNKNKIKLDAKRVQKLYQKQKILSNTLNLIVNNVSWTTLSIDYDDLQQNQEETLQKIYRFLELADHNPTSDFEKSINAPYHAVIENFEEIEKIFKR